MRLQAEEQNEQVMSRMVTTQKQLEQQIRNLSTKGKPTSNVTGAPGNQINGIGANITPIESMELTMGDQNQSDTFADFVRDASHPTAPS